MYRNILVATDGSDAANLGLREAIELARSLGGRIRLVHVVNKTPWISPEVAASVVDDLFTQLRSAGESILHEAKTAVRSAGVEVDDRLIEAPGERAGEIVIGEANEWPAQLIVCGTHGRRGVRRLLMGSDAEYIVRLAPVPVLLVRGGSS